MAANTGSAELMEGGAPGSDLQDAMHTATQAYNRKYFIAANKSKVQANGMIDFESLFIRVLKKKQTKILQSKMRYPVTFATN
jgi:hypothetical protein